MLNNDQRKNIERKVFNAFVDNAAAWDMMERHEKMYDAAYDTIQNLPDIVSETDISKRVKNNEEAASEAYDIRVEVANVIENLFVIPFEKIKAFVNKEA